MEYTKDGHIKRVRELDTNFTIPKKKQKIQEIETKSVVNDIPEMETKKSSYVDPYANLLEEYKNAPPVDRSTLRVLTTLRDLPIENDSDTSFTVPDPDISTDTPPDDSNSPTVPIEFLPEVSVTYSNYVENIGNTIDTLPKELIDLFQPLFCKLCKAKLESVMVAKIHYNSTKHEKKIVNYLIEYAAATKQPVHEFVEQYTLKKRKEEGDYNPMYFHCDVCDLALTSKSHAQSHYAGKNHSKMLQGRKCPAKGYFEDGKFIRRLDPPKDAQRTDGFGLDFDTTEPASSSKEVASSLRCELCKVFVTSLPTMQSHLDGQKHKKKLRQKGIVVETTTPTSAIYASSKTPSGQFYCKQCDLCFITEKQFSGHLLSRSHLKKANIIKD